MSQISNASSDVTLGSQDSYSCESGYSYYTTDSEWEPPSDNETESGSETETTERKSENDDDEYLLKEKDESKTC